MKTQLLHILLLANVLILPARSLNFERIDATNGLSQLSVMTIYQDEIGYMWFGTRAGLNRYDGSTISVFQVEEDQQTGLSSNLINYICGDSNGKLYMICGYTSLTAYDLKLNTFSTLKTNCQVIAQGQQNVWYSSENTIYRINSQDSSHEEYHQLPAGTTITALTETRSNSLFVGTEKGLWHITPTKKAELWLKDFNISVIYEDEKKNTWIGTTDQGVVCRYPDGTQQWFQETQLSSNIIRTIIQDNSGNIWIGTFNGLNKIDQSSGTITHYKNEDQQPNSLSNSLSHNSIYSLYKDRQGTIWIGTYFGGVNYFNPEIVPFTHFHPAYDSPFTVNNPITGKMAEDIRGNLWICTEGGGLNFYDRTHQRFTHFKATKTVSHNNLKCIWYDKDFDRLYIGTHTAGLDIYDIPSGTFQNISTHTHTGMPHDVVVALQPYGDELIIATHGGTIALNKHTQQLRPFTIKWKDDSTLTQRISVMMIDSHHNFWFNYKSQFIKHNLITTETTAYSHSFDQDQCLGRMSITCIYENRHGRVFLGSNGSGLFEYIPGSGKFKRHSVTGNNLLSNFIYAIDETSYGSLVLLTIKGLNIYDPDTGISIHLDKKNGFPMDIMNYGNGLLTTTNGDVFAGGTNGMVHFHESQPLANNIDYDLFFSEISINNQKIHPLGKDKILSRSVPYTNSITLRHHQNNFSISYASTNHIKSNKRHYSYKLEGFNDEWVNSSDPTISYTNLNPGKYIVKVRENAHTSSLESTKEISLVIKILPPFYASTPAYVGYLVLILLISWKINQFNKSKIQLRTSLEFEKRENERIQELNQTKLRFFTNISHEFRTPLTLIIGQLESITQLSDSKAIVRNKLQRVYKNALHLRNLISELLDFRKQENDLLELKVSYQDIVGFTRSIYQQFHDLALRKSVDFQFTCAEKTILIWFDSIQFRKVVYNLLSNAFKHTPDGGEIQVKIERKKEGIILSISDNGSGIPPEELPCIFERFYQANNQGDSSVNTFSSGMGLTITKGIVALHHGTIQALNNPQKGCTFLVTLQTGSDHFSDKEKTPESNQPQIYSTELPTEDFNYEELQHEVTVLAPTAPSILIVEDNEEMRDFLTEIFRAIYSIETANDGLEALEKLKTNHPDLVISDVMMPVMTGKELCAKIKSNVETSHIPVVLLTADSSEKQNLEGLMAGSDDYITKPFNVKTMISRCNNLIRNRKILQEKFQQASIELPVTLATNKYDQEFVEKATVIVNQHLNDTSFDIGTFATEMALGKSKLHLKIKGITGLTPNEFIQNIRMKKARQMLIENPEMNISEIAYSIGFSAPRYFSQCFKEMYGISPLTYRKDIGT